MDMQRFEFDSKQESHRLLKLALEQVLKGNVIVGCGTAVKALEKAKATKEPAVELLTVGLISDALGVEIDDVALKYWQGHASDISEGQWLGMAIRTRWVSNLRARAAGIASASSVAVNLKAQQP